jgi:hypothetical protein
MRPPIVVALALLALAGCGKDASPRGNDPRPPGDLAGPLVYQRAGGLAGRADTFTLAPDGRARVISRLTGTRSVTLKPAELAGVKRALGGVDLSRLHAEYQPPRPVADGVAERVTYAGETVSAATGGDPPQRLVSLLVALSGLVDRYAPRR